MTHNQIVENIADTMLALADEGFGLTSDEVREIATALKETVPTTGVATKIIPFRGRVA